ncbi:MAG: S16 family serine protease [Candidatus Woesearchaeota archaeon]
MKKQLLIFFLVLISTINYIQVCVAETGKITLLALSGDENNLQGNTVELSLEVKPGKGDIYIDSFPLTKLDTQITIRFAQEIACDFLDKDCRNYDFFYKLRSEATLFGGPSAGAATTVLTIAVLDNQKLDEKTTMTGTINPGGLIGPVGGVYEKALAAQKNGFKKILIPRWDYTNNQSSAITIEFDDENETSINNNISNNNIPNNNEQNPPQITTGDNIPVININNSNIILNRINISNISKNIINIINISSKNRTNKVLNVQEKLNTLNITILKVINLEEAMIEFTGKNYSMSYSDIIIDKTYTNTMKKISDDLCERYSNTGFDYLTSLELRNDSLKRSAEEYYTYAQNAEKIGRYYSRASFCFSANIKMQQLVLRNKTNNELITIMENLTNQIETTKRILYNMSLKSVGDLETYMIVKERLVESENLIKNIDKNNISYENLAYALERYYSAIYWSEFFGKNKEIININKELLRDVCLKKISEADERINFVELYISPLKLSKQRENMLDVATELNRQNYEMCIFKASKVKADADVIATSLYVGDDTDNNLLNEKLEQIKKIIIRQQQKNRFPILGYSYYEYSQSLLESDPKSAMIYSEYALELSNLEMYFPKERKIHFSIENIHIIMLLLGFILGILVTLLFISIFKVRFVEKKIIIKKSKNKMH